MLKTSSAGMATILKGRDTKRKDNRPQEGITIPSFLHSQRMGNGCMVSLLSIWLWICPTTRFGTNDFFFFFFMWKLLLSPGPEFGVDVGGYREVG